MELISCKQRFFEENTDFIELKGEAEATIGEFQNIDKLEDEVWLMQCPKGTDVTELQGQKLKLPGRSSFAAMEAVALEFPNAENHAFGYCNHKGRYALRLLPVRGSIVLRSRLKPIEVVTADTAEALCPPMGRVPMPEVVKVRHPLHGHQFDEHLRLDESVTARLKQADEVSAQVLREVLASRINGKDGVNRLTPTKAKRKSAPAPVVQLDSSADDDDDVEFGSETKAKKKKKKPKHNEATLGAEKDVRLQAETRASKKKKSKKSKEPSSGEEEVSQDLQWLQKI